MSAGGRGRGLARIALAAAWAALSPLQPWGAPSAQAQDAAAGPPLRPLAPRVGRLGPSTVGSGAYGNLVAPAGALRPNTPFGAGLLDPDVGDVVGHDVVSLDALALPERRGSDRAAASSVDAAVDAETGLFAGRRDAAADAVGPGPERGVPRGCAAGRLQSELQAVGTFWNSQARSAVPAAFPLGVLTGSVQGSADPTGLGAFGRPANVPAEGPGGGWCRPPPVPMLGSSPLETNWFLTLLFFPLIALMVFWLSRGFSLSPIEKSGGHLSSGWRRDPARNI